MVIYDSVSGTTYTLSASRSGMGAVPPPVPPAPVTLVENIQELTEEQLLAKINRDVALWREGHHDQSVVRADPITPAMTDYTFESLDDDGLTE